MPLFNAKRKPFSYDLIREGEDNVMRINCEQYSKTPSLEDDPVCMQQTINNLIESANVTKIIFTQKRDYEYDFSQTQMLIEIANLFRHVNRQKEFLSYNKIAAGKPKMHAKFDELQMIISNMLRSDPIGAYVELVRMHRREKILLSKTIDSDELRMITNYITLIEKLLTLLDQTKLIIIAKPYLAGYQVGDRSAYRRILSPSIKPDFMFTKLMASYPPDGKEIANYTIGEDTEITVFRLPDTIQLLYHMMPPEFKLNEDEYEILDLARNILAEHKPTQAEFVDPERMRQVFFNVGKDLIDELAKYRNMSIREKDLEKLTNILVRYTVGFGLIEVLLQDEKIQDISVNSPMGQIPIFIVHADFDDCMTNIVPTTSEAESWASKLRMVSGRPLDEADPVLDTELELPGASTRVAVIAPPLNPTGLAYSFRRHRDRPWTLPLFIKAGMINAEAAGLLSFLIDGTRTLLIAGTRSSGKSSLLSSLLVEIMRRYRIITIEDTLELPSNSLRKLGFNIQSMKVAGALSKGTSEVSAEDGIRTTLRLGDSSLIIGEVRSKEATALYEAMRVGAAANVVAGTIHGDSPYGVFDRVVNDIGVPKTSFKATDIIIVANPIKSADGLHKMRRVTQITEVRKTWTDDPLAEGGFIDLMKYDAATDEMQPMDGLINGESEILKMIAGNIKEFAGNWDAVWDNIQLRAKIKQAIVDAAAQLKDDSLLEAPFVIKCNDQFHILSEKIKDEKGIMDPKLIFTEWTDWLKKELRRRKKDGSL